MKVIGKRNPRNMTERVIFHCWEVSSPNLWTVAPSPMIKNSSPKAPELPRSRGSPLVENGPSEDVPSKAAMSFYGMDDFYANCCSRRSPRLIRVEQYESWCCLPPPTRFIVFSRLEHALWTKKVPGDMLR